MEKPIGHTPEKQTRHSSGRPAVRSSISIVGRSLGRSSLSVPKRPRVKLFVGIMLIAGCLLASLAMAATYINNRPEKVLADALTNTTGDLLDGTPISATGNLVFESKGEQPVKVWVTFDSRASAENSAGSATIRVLYSGKVLNLKASTIILGNGDYYFKIENLKQAIADVTDVQPVFSTYALYTDPIVAKLDNKWVKVTKDDLNQPSGVDTESFDKCMTALKNLDISKTDQQEIKKIFKQNQFIRMVESLKSEKVAGEDSFHYKLDFNGNAFKNFANLVAANDSLKTAMYDCRLVGETVHSEFKYTISQNSKEKKPVVELWVSKNSRRPTKLRLNQSNQDLTADFSTEFKMKPKVFTIEKPAGAISIDSLKTDLEKITASNISNL